MFVTVTLYMLSLMWPLLVGWQSLFLTTPFHFFCHVYSLVIRHSIWKRGRYTFDDFFVLNFYFIYLNSLWFCFLAHGASLGYGIYGASETESNPNRKLHHIKSHVQSGQADSTRPIEEMPYQVTIYSLLRAKLRHHFLKILYHRNLKSKLYLFYFVILMVSHNARTCLKMKIKIFKTICFC